MATIIGIMGESGSGKTTSMRNLNPSETYYLDCDKKGLSWRGWKAQYNAEKKNYLKTDDQTEVLNVLIGINKLRPNIKTIIIDTLNGIMIADEIRRMREKGYDKWVDLAASVYNIIDYALTMRDDITVIFVTHSQTIRDDSGNTFTCIKTSGQKLTKIGLETKFPIVLNAKVLDGRYVFETQANFSTAKSPLGMIPDKIIDNDMAKVLELVREYEKGE